MVIWFLVFHFHVKKFNIMCNKSECNVLIWLHVIKKYTGKGKTVKTLGHIQYRSLIFSHVKANAQVKKKHHLGLLVASQ